jgi:hypothetical protein
MKFNNLRRQILANLGQKWRETNTIQTFDFKTIQSEFADIPETDFETSIRSLEDGGHIQRSHDGRTISLTHKGLDHLRIIIRKKRMRRLSWPKNWISCSNSSSKPKGVETMYKKILVPLDGSKLAEIALPHAEKIQSPRRSSVKEPPNEPKKPPVEEHGEDPRYCRCT